MAFDAQYVRSRLSYDPESGKLTWLPKAVRSGSWKRHDLTWNTRYAGQETGYEDCHGYLIINIGGRPHHAHRLAWLHVHGAWPREFIDHINRRKTDNRLCNLREATPAQNLMNKVVRKDSRSGVKGVQWHSQSGRWRARIRVDGKPMSLGLFMDIEAAATAYKSAALAFFGEYAGGAS